MTSDTFRRPCALLLATALHSRPAGEPPLGGLRRIGQKNDVATAERLWRDALVAAVEADNGVGISVATAPAEPRGSATLLGATEAAREAMRAAPDERELAIRSRALALLGQGATSIEGAWAAGRALDLASALELATRTADDQPEEAPD